MLGKHSALARQFTYSPGSAIITGCNFSNFVKHQPVFCQQQFVFLIAAITQFTWWHHSASAAITFGEGETGQKVWPIPRLAANPDQVIAKPTQPPVCPQTNYL